MLDLIIIGCGPAGMTAAVYGARKKLEQLLLTKEFGGQPMWTRHIENYMGYQYITGPELMAKFEEQVKQFPVATEFTEVTSIEIQPDQTFLVKTAGQDYACRSVLIASGKRPRKLNVPGEEKYIGLGVSYCATCDGPLFTNKEVAVMGGGNSAVQAAIELSRLASKVYLVSRSTYIADPVLIDRLNEQKNVIELKGYEAKALEGDQLLRTLRLQEITTGQEKVLPVKGVFVEIGLMPNSDFAKNVVAMTNHGEIITDCRMNTSIQGIFAAGDVTDGPDKQIVVAAGDGAKAVLGIYEYLMKF